MADLTVVIPILNDSDALARLLAELPAQPGVEFIVVDGGADPRLEPLLSTRADARLLRGTAGRGAQMNLGARHSSSAWLLFLHADCMPPSGFATAITHLPTEIVGGWFQFTLDSPAWQARVIECLVGWRVRMFGLAYGDQGLFVRSETFERLGGFREWPLMEDVDLVRRLRRAGRSASLALRITSSARRWRRDGWFRRSARNLCLVTLYFAGVAPTRLARWYEWRGLR